MDCCMSLVSWNAATFRAALGLCQVSRLPDVGRDTTGGQVLFERAVAKLLRRQYDG